MHKFVPGQENWQVQRGLAAKMFGNGMEYSFAQLLMQRARWERSGRRACPRCDSLVFHGAVMIDRHMDGIWCSECYHE